MQLCASSSFCDSGQVHSFFTFPPFSSSHSPSLCLSHTHTQAPKGCYTHIFSSQISNKKLTDQRPEEYKRAAGRASEARACLLIQNNNKNQENTTAPNSEQRNDARSANSCWKTVTIITDRKKLFTLAHPE